MVNEAHAQLPAKEILRVLWPFLAANKQLAMQTTILMTVSTLASVSIPYLGKQLIDDPTQASTLATNEGGLSSNASLPDSSEDVYSSIVYKAATLMVVFAMYHAISCWGHLSAYKLGMHVSTEMIKKCVEALSVVPWEDTIQQNPAEYSQTLVQASRFAGETVATIVTNMYPNVIGAIGFTVMVVLMSPSLTFLFAIVVLFTQTFQRWRQTRINLNSNVVGQQEAKTLAVVTNTIQRSALIRLFDCSDFVLNKLDQCAERSISSAANLNFAIHSNAAVGSGTTNCLFVLIVAIMVWRRSQEAKAFSTLDIALYFMLMGQLLNKVTSIASEVNSVTTLLQRTVPFVLLMRRAETNGRSDFTIKATSASVLQRERADVEKTSVTKAITKELNNHLDSIVLSLSDVGFVYNKAFSASDSNATTQIDPAQDMIIPVGSPTASTLRNINIRVKRGSFVGIVGSSGGGKTTILRLMAGLLKPTSGEIRMSEEVCMLEQGSSIVVGTISENILIGKPKATQRELNAAVVASGSLGFIQQLQAGLDTQLDNIDVSGLSGGQLQRICLARVFLSSANIVLFDEPTTGLDPISSERFYETAMRLRDEGRTIILVTHEHQLVSKADVVFAVKAGHIVGEGSYADLKPLLANLHDHHN